MHNKSVQYIITYHHLVLKDDVALLNRDILERIKTAIENRLRTSPEMYGVRLRKSLKDYWKLRVGDYRIVFSIIGNHVRILAIRHRKEVYSFAIGRR